MTTTLSDGVLKGAHVKIGDYVLMLDEKGTADHYNHHWETILADQQTIPGRPGKRNVRQEKLLWDFDDWSGGEGNRIYYPDDPTVYLRSDGANGRIRGQLTGRPARVSTTVAVSDKSKQCFLANAAGLVWVLGDDKVFYSSDYGVSFTGHAQNAAPTITGDITAVAGSEDYLYVSSYSGTTRYLYRVDSSTCVEVITGGSATTVPFMGMDVFNGYLYGWTGRRLFEYQVNNTLPLTAAQYKKVYDTGTDVTVGSTYYGDVVAGDTSLFMFLGTAGRSKVYEYHRGAGAPLWKLDYGFTVKSLVHQGGILYAAGHYGGDGAGNGRGAMYALPLDSLRELFIGWFRKDSAFLQMQQACGSYGKQIMVAGAFTGRVFIYDAEMDAISLLDDLPFDFGDSPQLKIGSLLTFGPKRLAAVYSPGSAGGTSGNYTVYGWSDDEPGVRESGIAMPTMESGTWDYDFPQERKILVGFHVTFVPLSAGQTIDISYNLDGNGWVSLTQITSTTDNSATGGGKASEGRVFLPVSTGAATKKFYNMKFRVDGAGTAVLPPIIYGAVPESSLLAKVEIWDLVVRVADEDQLDARPSSRAIAGEDIRTYLETLVQNQAIVTFLDGYRYKRRPGTYSTHTVMVLEGTDSIVRLAEGSFSLRLMAIVET